MAAKKSNCRIEKPHMNTPRSMISKKKSFFFFCVCLCVLFSLYRVTNETEHVQFSFFCASCFDRSLRSGLLFFFLILSHRFSFLCSLSMGNINSMALLGTSDHATSLFTVVCLSFPMSQVEKCHILLSIACDLYTDESIASLNILYVGSTHKCVSQSFSLLGQHCIPIRCILWIFT